MQLVLLDFGVGLEQAVQTLIGVAVLLIPIGLVIYFIFLKNTKKHILSGFFTAGITLFIAQLLLFIISQLKGAEPFETIFDPSLFQLAYLVSFFSIAILFILSIIGAIKRKP